MRTAAKASGMSQSRWVAHLIEEKNADEWPQSVTALAGAWHDLPTAEQIRGDMDEDLPRESF